MRNRPDKRYYNRLKTKTFSIEYKIINGSGVYRAEVINISAGGMCFLRTSILEKGDILQIKFPFQAKKVILTGQIIRIEGREVAIKFLDDERQIDKFVENFNIEFIGAKVKGKIVNEKHILYDDTAMNHENKNDNNMFNDIDKE